MGTKWHDIYLDVIEIFAHLVGGVGSIKLFRLARGNS
jgi:hypothetical protein